MKKLIIIIASLLLQGCLFKDEIQGFKELFTEKGQKEAAERDRVNSLRWQAEQDAINLQQFSNSPTCQGHYSPNWTKVVFDENQGYCILRPKPIRDYSKESNAIPGEIEITKQNNKKKKSK